MSSDTCKFLFSSREEATFKVHTVFMFSLSLFGLFPNICQLWLIPKVSVWPVNVRLLLANTNCAALLTSICVIFRFFLYDIYYISNFASGSFQKVGVGVCRLLASSAAIASSPLAYSVPAIAVERWLITTNRLNPSEEKPQKLIILAIIGSWIMGLFTVAGLFLFDTPEMAQGQMCYCSYLVCLPIRILLFLCGLFLVQEVATNIFFYVVLHLNRTKLNSFCLDTVTHSLSDRFETRNTIRITKMAFPSVLFQTLIWFLISIAVLLSVLTFDGT